MIQRNLSMNNGRLESYQRNKMLETLLTELNELLRPAQSRVVKCFKKPRYPVLFVSGGPRTGTTLMMQWLASTRLFAYPSNLLSRFYAAPHIGAKIQLMLTDPEYAFRDETNEFTQKISFKSDLGKTSGVLSPNEFWYFWRRFIPITSPQYLDKAGQKKIKNDLLLAEIAAIENVFNKPFVMKSLILLLNLDYLAQIFKNAVFLILHRHPFFTIQSLIESREKFFGTREKWYSIKPKEFNELKNLDPIKQVTGQVYYTNESVRKSLQSIDPSRYIIVNYEDFCSGPGELFRKIKSKYNEFGVKLEGFYNGPKRFSSNNLLRVSNSEIDEILSAYNDFSGESLSI